MIPAGSGQCQPQGRRRQAPLPIFVQPVVPQETHTKEVSWLLFAHEKIQKVNIQVTEAFPRIVRTPLPGCVGFPPGRLLSPQNTVALRADSVPGSRALMLNDMRWPLQGEKLSVKGPILPMRECITHSV